MKDIEALVPDLDQASLFLKLLDPSVTDFVFQTFDDSKEHKDPTLARTYHGSLDQHARELTRMNQKGAGVFVTVNHSRNGGRKKADIDGYRAIFREADAPDLPCLPIEPHIMVESSPEKHHEYLLIEQTSDGETWDETMSGMVAGWGSDKNARDRSRVLRLPGYYHLKNPYSPHLVKIIHEGHHKRYSLEQVGEHIKPVIRHKAVLASALAPGTQRTYGQVALSSELQILAGAHEGDRNAQLNKSTYTLGRLVAGGELDRARVENALMSMALSIGLPDGEAEATIKSGLDAGAQSPRQAPVKSSKDLRDYTPEQGIDVAATPPGKKKWFKTALALASAARFIDYPAPDLDFVFKDSLMAGTTGLVVGSGGVGKSTLAIMMLMAVATGRDILPGIFTPTRAGKVLGIFAEDDEKVLHHRVRGMVDKLFYFDREAQELLKENMLLITTVGHDVRLLDASSSAFAASQFFIEVLEEIKNLENLRLIIPDPTSRFHGGEENDNVAGTFYVSLLEQVAQATGAAVVGLHHVSKRAGIGSTGVFDLEAAMHQDAARGASGLTNGVRWQCNLFGLPESYAKKEMGDRQARPGQYLALRVSKKNYGPPEDQHFLERLSGGVFRVVEPATKANDPDLDAIVKGLLLDAVFRAEGKQLTKRTILDGNHQAWKQEYPKITRSVVGQTIAACIINGELFERQGKNASGKSIVYLSRYPEPPAILEPEIEPEGNLEPEIEPEDFEPEIPERTVENESTVYNLLNLNNIVNPEKENRKKDDIRFVSPRNCGTVEPEISTPYGGDISPSGLNRVDTPQLPLEVENAEFF